MTEIKGDKIVPRRITWVKVMMVGLVGVIISTAIVVGMWLYQTDSFSKELRDGLVKSCETNGNPLREAVQKQIEERIEQRHQVDYSALFPNFPKQKLDELLAKQERADMRILREIEPVDCQALYPDR